MDVTTAVLYTTFFVQAAGALLTAAVLLSLFRHYRRGYLLHWTRSWFALCITLLAAAAEMRLSYPDPLSTWRYVAMVITVAAAYLQLGWLFLGTRELATGRKLTTTQAQWMLIGLTLFGLATALLFAWDAGQEMLRFMMRVGVRSLVAGAAFLTAAYAVWRDRHARHGLGHQLVTGAFIIYALEQFHYAGLTVYAFLTDAFVPYAAYLGYFHFLLQFAMGLGMVIWLLEDERRATIEAAEQIQHLAFHDALTGLPNRQLFLDRLDLAIHHAHRGAHQLAVFFLDLDRFKIINDSLGHSAGDQLLQQVSQRVRALLREDDTVTRLGGDEFTILAPQVRNADDAVVIARKVRDAIKAPFVIDGRELFVTTSIGISLYPSDGTDAETLLKNADTAMYRAKAQGRDIFRLYTSSMNDHALEQLTLENGLRRAIVDREFVVRYQPIVDLATGKIAAMETVLRWQHPELGLLLPQAFIGLAETTGLIVPIGEWVLRTACRQVREWQERGHPGLRAAVNLSVRQLQHPEFVSTVSEILATTGLPASALELEITESIAMQSDDGTVEKLRELKRLGVRISIDDFGTGYSSLMALRLFPVDALKIDRSFVGDLAVDPDDAEIAAAVIALAHSLKLAVIAEGVETMEQLEFLRAHRCDGWQGYLFCEPASVPECDAILGRRWDTPAYTPMPAVRHRVSGEYYR